MHDPAFAEEKKIQFEKDQTAYTGLSERQKNIADKIAAAAFLCRKGIVTAGKAIVGVIEAVFNLCFYLPYKIALRACGILANTVVGGVKLCVATLVGAGRACLAAGRGALNVGEKCVNYLSGKGWISDETKEKSNEKIADWRVKLHDLRESAVAWGKKVEDKIDHGWATAKENMVVMKDKAIRNLEYYGALSLYRGTKWILDPRTPSGKPLLYWESLNKAVGFTIAATGFCVFAYEVSKLTFLSKILHVKLAASFLTDPASLAMRLTKQLTLHPAITLGVTALKFFSLPVIAATRQALKSTPFTQGVAYQYNKRLNEKTELKLQKTFARQAKDNDLFRSTGHTVRKYSRLASLYLRKKSLSFVEKFVGHIVEKASPEFYEGRLKHYKSLEQNGMLTDAFKTAGNQQHVNDNAAQPAQAPAAKKISVPGA